MKYILNTLIIIAAIILLGSCSEDFLDTNPTSKISNSLALSNYDNLAKATNGLYGPLCSSDYYGAYMQIAPEIMADNVKRSTVEGSSRYVEEFNLTIAPNLGYYSGLWSQPYYIISGANNIINTIEGGDFDQQTASNAEINQLLGEALFVRALCHFDLCRLFAHHYTITDTKLAPGADGDGGHWGIPIVLKTDISNFPPRNTVKEVYRQVTTDLRNADKLITFDKGKDKANNNSVRALLARVYYYKGDIDSAAYFAEQVIGTYEYPLSEGEDVVNYWTKEDGDETIFQVYSNATEDYFPGSASLGGLFNIGDDYVYSDLVITEGLYNLFDPSDKRLGLYYRDKNNEIRTKKFLPKEGNTSPYENNIKVLRISEMYLISAEAGNVDRMNEFLEARGLPAVSTVTKTLILNERRKELACEGNRLFDLAIAEKDNVRPENNATPLVNYPDHRYVLPIPIREIERNKNISNQQNPGY